MSVPQMTHRAVYADALLILWPGEAEQEDLPERIILHPKHLIKNLYRFVCVMFVIRS